ncbi:MAG: tryptophan tryptophylquinone biosynthesis enzyme MauG [Zetaproteobacteria bacterium]|nr:tryptophan tryptophylquinone biosynthesis enzyme MauG [Zetaproteobacteria bacterium]
MRTVLGKIGVLGALLGFAVVPHAVQAKSAKEYRKDYQRPKSVPYPDENKYSKAREELGKTLFFDPRLSSSNWISCATCHNPAFSWGDGLPLATGHGMKILGRRTPTILNLAWGEDALFWDGRSDSLEDQALGPIEAAGEMNLPLDQMEKKLQAIASYKPLFEKAYPKEGITRDTVAKAIATYERGVVSGEAPFDRYVKGDDKAISKAAQRGFVLFNEKARCNICHSGWRFTDDSFHDIGVPGKDLGRGKVLEEASLNHAFKTPTLRNADHRGPFMHDGSEADLAAVIDLYNIGGREKRKTLSKDIKPLGLTKSEQADLIEFLHTLTSEDKPVTVPVMPR